MKIAYGIAEAINALLQLSGIRVHRDGLSEQVAHSRRKGQNEQ